MDRDALFTIAFVLSAPISASFIGTLVDRIPSREPFILARSHCMSCNADLRAFELLPIASFVALAGRCSRCEGAIPARYFFCEVAALFGAVAIAFTHNVPAMVISLPLGWLLLGLSYFDLSRGRLPHAVTAALCISGLILPLFAGGHLMNQAIGMVIGSATSTAIAFAYRSIRKRDGLGGGDVNMFAGAGAWVGLDFFGVLFGAAVTALAFAAVTGRGGDSERIPFGPFIALSIWCVWILKLYGMGLVS